MTTPIKNGIDCSTKITKTVAKALVKAEQTFVARYLVQEKFSKALLLAEAQIISDAGLNILSCYETTASRALSDATGGAVDGQIALDLARKIGQTKGSAIYFAVDFDVTLPEQYNVIERYLRAAQTALGTEYFVGVYAEFTVIEAMNLRKACKHFWQTYAWSAGKLSKFANVYQFKNGQSMGGITVDLNNSFGNEGFWNLRKATTTPLTDFTDVPAGHPFESAIANVSGMGIMVGGTDGTFGLGDTVTREELAVILTRYDAYVKGVKKNDN